MPAWTLLPPDKEPTSITFEVASILLDSTGDLDPSIQLVEGGDAVAQRIFCRLRFIAGEWFLDQRLGFPWFRDVLIMAPDLVLVKSEIRRTIEETPGVAEVTNIDAVFTRSARSLVVSFEAILQGGSILTVSAQPFIFSDAATDPGSPGEVV